VAATLEKLEAFSLQGGKRQLVVSCVPSDIGGRGEKREQQTRGGIVALKHTSGGKSLEKH